MRKQQRKNDKQQHARQVARAVRAMCAIERPSQTVETVTVLERVSDPQYVAWCRGIVRFTDGALSGFHVTGAIATDSVELTRPPDDAHAAGCPCPDCFGGPDDDPADDPRELAEDYPGQRITGPDFDTRDREGWRIHPAIVHIRHCADCQQLRPCAALAEIGGRGLGPAVADIQPGDDPRGDYRKIEAARARRKGGAR